MNKIPTTCVYCGCGCGLYLHIENGQVVGASPSPLHPMSKGRLCIKGWLIGEFVGHPDRLKYPLIKEGDRFVRASWDKALNLVATRFKELGDSYGPDSLGVLTSAKGTNEENYLLMKLARAASKDEQRRSRGSALPCAHSSWLKLRFWQRSHDQFH